MAIIVDANVAVETFKNCSSDFKPILDGLFNGKLILAFGGKLAEEYSRITEVMRIVNKLDQAGKAISINEAAINNEIDFLAKSKLCCSNDLHVIAVARLSKAQLLCSKDKLLHTDFTNKELLSKPRGKIYQNSSHIHLMQHLKC